MVFIEDFTIQEAIIHVMDINNTTPILATDTLELDEKTYNFISKHIKSCIKNKKIKSGFFKEDSIIKEKVADNLIVKGNFIATSIHIANQLFSFLVNENKNSSDLLIALISTNIGPFIAIINLNYNSNFSHLINKEDNKTNVIIHENLTGLPQQSSKVNKAALIKCSSETTEYDLFVLEKLKSKEQSWFTPKFLECTIVSNDRDEAKKILKTIEKFAYSISQESPLCAANFRNEAKSLLTNKTEINIKELANDFLPLKEKEQFLELCEHEKINNDLKIDNEYIKKELETKKIKINKNIILTLPKEIYNDPSQFTIQENKDGSLNLVLKNVRRYLEK